MTDEDRPPEEIWLDEEALKEHFEVLRSKHKAGTGGSDEPSEDVPMATVPGMEGFRGRLRDGG